MKDILGDLIKSSREWASGIKIDLAQAGEMRREAARLLHAHYLSNIPFYQKFAGEEGSGKNIDIQTIKRKLMFAADIFKSYEQVWLDDGDFGKMTQWLSGIYDKRIDIDAFGIKTIDEWIERLDTHGIYVVYSSGTSGEFSFIPRDKQDWKLSRTANINCLAPLLAGRMAGNALSRMWLKSPAKIVSPDTFAALAGKKGLPDFDAFFLGFRHGRMGNQVLIEELAPLFRNRHFLYDTTITGAALRLLRRGASTDEEQHLLSKYREEIIGQENEHYLKLIDNIRQSTNNKQKIVIFGAPYQFAKLCEVAAGLNQRLTLPRGSFALFGGGWKSFTGEAISREILMSRLSDSLGIPPTMILEGYSMTEINVLMLRCEHGRFHIPPIIEPVILDEELNPLFEKDVKGAFGFLDPLAVSYPGFIISGDYVHMIDAECECGLAGPSITEIGRMPGSEVKGCGGIMSSMGT